MIHKIAAYAKASAQYVVMVLDAVLQNERVLTAGNGITVTDGGSAVTVASADVFGSMYIPGVDVIVPISTANPTEIKNADGDGWSAGELSSITFPTAGDEHYLAIIQSGKYEITWNLSMHTDTGGPTGAHGGIMIDGVSVRNNGEAHRDIANTNDTGNMAGIGIVDCPNGNEEISLWMINSLSNDLHIVHSTVTVRRIGET